MKDKNINFNVILFFFWMVLLSSLKAEAKEYSRLKQEFVTIDVFLKNKSIKEASVEFQMSKNGISTEVTVNYDTYNYKIVNGKGTFKVPLSTTINYGRITFFSSNIRTGDDNNTELINNALNLDNNLFLFSSGDHIDIFIDGANVTFGGKGNEKYNCLIGLSKLKYEVIKKLNVLPGQSEGEAKLNNLKEVNDSIYQMKTDFLKKYNTKMDSTVYELISADCWGEYNAQMIASFLILTSNGKERNAYDNAIERAYHSFVQNFDNEKYSEKILAQSYRYCDFLYRKELFALRFCNGLKPGYYNTEYTFKEVIEPILKSYSGLIYDKLIGLIFGHYLTIRSDTRLFFDEAIAKMGDNQFKNWMLLLEKNYTGNAFAFEMPDEKGELHRLSDYKGKVIVMDFWFTGCSGCAQLAREMKPIIKSYKSNPSIVFVSVSIDGEKFRELWLKSLQKEIYCSSDEINLLAREGVNSEIIKHYNIMGYPSVIVISKEGKIVSAGPPRPDANNPEKANEFKKLINKYIDSI